MIKLHTFSDIFKYILSLVVDNDSIQSMQNQKIFNTSKQHFKQKIETFTKHSP